jgi:hypothetical protein
MFNHFRNNNMKGKKRIKFKQGFQINNVVDHNEWVQVAYANS